MRLTKLFAGSLVVGGALAATSLCTRPGTQLREERLVTPVRSLTPARSSPRGCPPPEVAPSCYPGATRQYILWDKR